MKLRNLGSSFRLRQLNSSLHAVTMLEEDDEEHEEEVVEEEVICFEWDEKMGEVQEDLL